MTEVRFKNEVLPLSSRVYPLALRLLADHEAARDAVQQGMMKLWEKRRQLEQCNNITAFVFTVVRNLCLDELKKKRPVVFDDLTRVPNFRNDQTDAYEMKEAEKFVKDCIETLPDIQKEVISLRDIDGLEFEEIAEILNIEVAYARVLLSRARKKVREQFEKWYAYEVIQTR